MARQISDTFLKHTDVPPPPVDHVARALCKRDAREAALELLRAAVRRDPANERNAEALLRALEARPNASVAGPELVLNLDLVDMYLARGWFAEAKAVVDGAELAVHPDIAERMQWLEQMLCAHDDAPLRLLEAERHIANGQGRLGLTILEQWLTQVGALPPWAETKRALLVRILGEPVDDRDRVASSPTLPLLVRRCVEALSSRDFAAVESIVQEHLQRVPSDESARTFLSAFTRLSASAPAPKASSRSAFDTLEQAEFQLKMGNFSEAQSIYDALAKAHPQHAHHAVRAHDLDIVTHFLSGGTVVPGSMPPARLSVFPATGTDGEAVVITRRVIVLK